LFWLDVLHFLLGLSSQVSLGTIDYAPICPPLEEVAAHANRKVLMEIDDTNAPILIDPQGILAEQLRPRPIHVLNIFILVILIYH
jgi:hypothetical protein